MGFHQAYIGWLTSATCQHVGKGEQTAEQLDNVILKVGSKPSTC